MTKDTALPFIVSFGSPSKKPTLENPELKWRMQFSEKIELKGSLSIKSIVDHRGNGPGKNLVSFAGEENNPESTEYIEFTLPFKSEDLKGSDPSLGEVDLNGVSFEMKVSFLADSQISDEAGNIINSDIILQNIPEPNNNDFQFDGTSLGFNAHIAAYPADYQANMLGAYGLRKLSAIHNGPLIKVRTASSDTVVDIMAQDDGTLDTNAILAVSASEVIKVVSWQDQSLNNHHAKTLDGSVTRMPFIATNGTIEENGSGHPTLVFDGSECIGFDGIDSKVAIPKDQDWNFRATHIGVWDSDNSAGWGGLVSSHTLQNALPSRFVSLGHYGAGLYFMTNQEAEAAKGPKISGGAIDFPSNSRAIISYEFGMSANDTTYFTEHSINSNDAVRDTEVLPDPRASTLNLIRLTVGARHCGHEHYFKVRMEEIYLYKKNGSETIQGFHGRLNALQSVY